MRRTVRPMTGAVAGAALAVAAVGTLAAPAHGVPAHGAPAQGAPAYGVPAHAVPAHGAQAHGAHGMRARGTRALSAPAHGAQVHGARDARTAARASASAGGALEVFPSSVVPGGQVSVNTKACGEKAGAAGDASAVGAGSFTLAPSAHEGDAIGQFRVPESAQPGTYEIVAQCAEGGKEVRGDLFVTLTAAQGQVQPRGSVKTGVGGAGRDPVQTAAGVAALAVAAAGGTWLLHRRARGDGI